MAVADAIPIGLRDGKYKYTYTYNYITHCYVTLLLLFVMFD